MKSFTALAALAAAVSTAYARKFTVKNNCAETIWPALFTDLNVAQNVPDFPTG
jgi:hypothetical protein